MRSLRDHQSTPRDVHRTGRGSSNAKVTRRTIFRFAAQLAPGLLMAGPAVLSTPPPPGVPPDGRRVVPVPAKRESTPLTSRVPHHRRPLPSFLPRRSPPPPLFFSS